MKTCPFFRKCGGCTYLNKEYDEQLKIKKEEIRKLYPKHKVSDVIGMEQPYHYRHKVYATFYNDRNNVVHAGLYEENSHRLLDSTMCLLQHVKANRINGDIACLATEMKIPAYEEDSGKGVLRHSYIRVSHANGDVLLTIVIGSKALPSSRTFVKKIVEMHPEIKTVIINHNSEHTSMILGNKEDVVYGNGSIIDEISGVKFKISSRSFYQVNPVQTEKLYQTALDLAEIKEEDNVLDVCCGIGTISLLAAKRANYVVGVEINPQAIRDAIHNARLNHISNSRFYTDDSERFIERMMDVPDVVFLDPPRSGMGEKFMNILAGMGPERIVYVSCNPETQVKDTAVLLKKGYKIRKIVPVDMFCFTKHVETIVLLQKLNS